MFIVRFKGGIGNQLFQYAFALMLKEKFPNTKICYELSDYMRAHEHGGFLLGDIPFEKFSNFDKDKFRQITEHNCDFNFQLDEDLIFDGYWQDRKFLPNDVSPIRKFISTIKLDSQNQKFLEQIKCTENSVSVHIRRGDYVNHFLLGNIANQTYFENAINCICGKIEKPVFFVFSDDTEWVKKNLDFCGHDVFFSNNKNVGKNAAADLLLMSACKHNIISNSSFSWWAQYLNAHSEKNVIMPKYWVNCPFDNFISCTNSLLSITGGGHMQVDNFPVCSEKPANPTFSIIIPFYNSENFVRGTLLSALSQTYENIEIIAVDDKSTDGTLAVINEYAAKNKKIVVVAKEKNESAHCARISGVEKSSGLYCIFLDGDDTLLPNACEVIAEKIKSGLDIYEYEYLRQPEKTIKETEKFSPSNVPKLLLCGKIPPTIWNKAYKTSVLKKAVTLMDRFYANMSEDTYCSLVFNFCAETKDYIENPLVNYNMGSGISTRKKTAAENEKLFEAQKIVLEKVGDFVRRYLPELEKYLPELEKYFVRYDIDDLIMRQTTVAEEMTKSFFSLANYFSSESLVCVIDDFRKYRDGDFTFKNRVKRILKEKCPSWMIDIIKRIYHAVAR